MNWFISPSTKYLKNKSCNFFSLLFCTRFYLLLMQRLAIRGRFMVLTSNNYTQRYGLRTTRHICLWLLVSGVLLISFTAFGQAYSRAELPPLLEFLDGRKVEALDDWEERREEIRSLLIKFYIGSFPAETPKIVGAKVISEKVHDDGSIRRRIRVTLDTPNRVDFEMALWLPDGKDWFPLLLTAPRFYQRYWAEDALKRGYAVCLFPGVDSHHREADYPGYDSVWQTVRKEYSKATWTEISTKGWLASRCIDYLLGDQSVAEIDADKIAIIGFSRYGKQAMIAGAFDERISCVVARSPGSPASCPYRFTSRNTYAEAPSDFPSEWFLPSLRNFTGRENELPIDAHGWYGLIAPRHCLIHTAHNDGAEPTFAVEKAYIEGRSVYRLLGAEQNLRIDYRIGGHSSGPPPEQVSRADRQRNLDWMDLAFGRGLTKHVEFPEQLIHDFDWKQWRSQQNTARLAIAKNAPSIERVKWSLGQAPKTLPLVDQSEFFTDAESSLMTHDRWTPRGVRRVPIHFGQGVRGNLFFKEGLVTPAPVVVWLHPLSYHSGYNEGYGVQGTTVYHRLAENGFAVIAYDQCGFGLRLVEGRDFYKNHPSWSKLGRMVMDARAAVSFAVEGRGSAKSAIPEFDIKRVFLLGYSSGALTAMYASALDDRVAGVACFSGWTPLRDAVNGRATGGNRRLWELHGLQPLLGLFDGRESEIPFDYDDVLGLVLPKPCLVVTPEHDRFADFNAISDVIDRVRSAKPRIAKGSLVWLAPDDTNRFQADQHQQFINWTKTLE